MYLVNFVYDDEELLEPYEWQDDDQYQEFSHLPIYRIHHRAMHDFIYGKLCFENLKESTFIVGDGCYCVVVEVKDDCLFRRGTTTFRQRHQINEKIKTLSYSYFHYRILEEAYDKEFGLTRQERMKKICLEEVIDEIFVVHYELFQKICDELHIHEEGPSEQYLALKQKIEKGYSSLHELLYNELVKRR